MSKKPTVAQPNIEDIIQDEFDYGTCETTDGCCDIEPDGYCEHGHPSWMLYLGLI
jgi:hypothetical protein